MNKEELQNSGRTIRQVCEAAQEEFYKANGYYPTPEQAAELTDEARREIACEKEQQYILDILTDKLEYYRSLEEAAPLEKGMSRAYNDMLRDAGQGTEGILDKYGRIYNTLNEYHETNEDKAEEMRGYMLAITEVFRVLKGTLYGGAYR